MPLLYAICKSSRGDFALSHNLIKEGKEILLVRPYPINPVPDSPIWRPFEPLDLSSKSNLRSKKSINNNFSNLAEKIKSNNDKTTESKRSSSGKAD